MRLRARPVILCLVLLWAAVMGGAAGVTISGKVVDPARAALPGATVELWAGGRPVATVTTGADGTFSLASVAPGSYEIRVRLNGFRQLRMSLTVGTAPPRPLSLTLTIGSMTETVVVAGQSDAREGGVPGGVVGGVVGALPTSALPAGSPVPPPPAAPMGIAQPRMMSSGPPPFSTAQYARIEDNAFRRVLNDPLSTFSIDVDTASYANVRRFLNEGHLPPPDAVRVEELVNYFHFDYRDSTNDAPFGITTEVAACPWNTKHKLALVGLQAKRLPPGRTPQRNLVFLLDVSGSMMPQERLPLIKTAMKMLAETLARDDRVAIVVYAGASGVALPSTRGDHTREIQSAIDELRAGGSTNGAAGIQLAYQVAAANFVKGGVNRVILATDGDFNVGVTSEGELTRLIEDKRRSGVFLSVLGVGDDNLKDATMEKLADLGNGNYSYLDSLSEARRVLIAEAGSTLVTVAKDVKIQVEFNPAVVGAYRLVGYENRALRNEDFNNDNKDAGEMGAGHSVTAMYEIVAPGEDVEAPSVDPLKYQAPPDRAAATHGNEMMTVKVRYKNPDGDVSRLLEVPVAKEVTAAPRHVGFAAAVAEFGMLLRDSPFKGQASWDGAARLAKQHRGEDPDGYRSEFVRFVELAGALARQRTTTDHHPR